MKRILLVSSEFPPGPGGIGRHAADLCLALAHKGYLIDVWANIDYANQNSVVGFRAELPDNINLNHFRRIGFLTYPVRIIKVFGAIRNNIHERLVFTGKFPLWIGGLVKLVYGKRRIVEIFVHGSEINPVNSFIRWITHRAIGRADRIWAVSEFTRSILPEKIKRQKEIYILSNGIHSSEWPMPDEIKSFKDWKGSPKLLTVGSISPRKGQHRVISALTALKRTFPDIHYHIVGMDTNAGYLHDKIKSLNLEEHITLHGRLPGKKELAMAYKTSDIFIMLSENQLDGDVEGFGISILEANLYGLPAIGARGCGIEDAIVPGTNGELVDGANSQAICDAVIKIINDTDNYRMKMKDWLNRHEWDNLVDDFIEVR